MHDRRPSRPATIRGIALIAGLALALTTPRAAEPCSALPADRLPVGQRLLLDGLAIELLATRTVESLDLDLLVRRSGADTGEPLAGSYVPHLEASYTLVHGEQRIRNGRLDFRFPAVGPSLGTSLPLESLAGLETVRLDVSVRDASPIGERRACPTFPIELRFTIDPGAVPEDVADDSTAALASADFGFNLVGSLDPDFGAGSQYSDVWGWSNGSVHLAILGNVDGTHFIDVTDAGNPVEIAFLPGSNSPWRDMKTYQNYAYIVTEAADGLQIVDLTNPLAPLLVNQTTEFFFTAHNIWLDEDTGLLWVVGANNGTRILNLEPDPASPTFVASWSERYVHDAFVENGLAYFSEISDGLHEILDSQEPTDLVSLSLFATPGNKTHNSWTNEQATFLVTTDEVSSGTAAVYDITTKTDPNPQIAEYWSGTGAYIHNVVFDGGSDRVAISHYSAGVKYVDFTIPSAPIEIASYDTYPNDDGSNFNGVWGVYTDDPRGYIYASDRGTGLYILEYAPAGGVLAVTVLEQSSDSPLPGIDVQILPSGESRTTDADGQFALALDEGPLTVRAASRGFKTALVNTFMPAGGTIELEVRLDRLPTRTLSGVVRDAATSAPIGAATISIEDTFKSASSAADGSFSIANVPIGQQTVIAERLGYASLFHRVVLAENGPASLDVRLEPGLFVDDVESDRGWDLGLGDPAGTQGRWERVDPNQTSSPTSGVVQPGIDHTPDPGSVAFITGQSAPGADVHSNDVEFGTTTLRGPAMDATGTAAPRLRYHRWFSNNGGATVAGSLTVEVSSNAVDYVPLESVTQTENIWRRKEFALQNFLTPGAQVRLRFIAEPGSFSPGAQVLECGVDDIDLVSGCLARFSPELGNADGDDRVDACDACMNDPADDADGDGFCGDVDNTPFVTAPGQEDADLDSVGDAADNCPTDANTDQADRDGDGLGNACDSDIDGDGLGNDSDDDRDGDGVADAVDLCPSNADAGQQDFDGDGDGDLCDLDDGLVQGVTLDPDFVRWVPEAGSDGYNLYRGDLGAAALLPFAICRFSGIATNYQPAPELPIPGDGFFYLVTRTAAGIEGSLGLSSSGAERAILEVCP